MITRKYHTDRSSLRLAILIPFLILILSGRPGDALAQSAQGSGVDVLDRERRQAPSAPLSRPRPSISRDAADKPVYDPGARFILASVTVEGATAYSSEELTAPYNHLLGELVSFVDIDQMAEEMGQRYRKDGYVLSRVVITPQSVDPDGAEVALVAIEGFLSDIVFQGDEVLAKEAAAYFSASATKLLALRPLRFPALERALTLLQDAPGITVSSVFESSEVPSASVLVINVERSNLSGSLSVNNTGTESSGPLLISGNLTLSGFPGIGFQTSLGYTQAWKYEEYYSFSLAQSYNFSGGLSLSASYAFSESQRPGTDFAKLFDHATESHTLNVAASYPIIRGRDKNLSLGLSYTHRDSQAEILGDPFTRDRLRALAFSANFDFSDEIGGVTQATLTLTTGLKAFGATHLDAGSSSPLAPANYKKANLYLFREQRLPLGLSLTLAGEIQLAGSILPSYEQFSLGGQLFGRGFESGTLDSDNGIGGYLELRRPIRARESLTVTPFAFIDGGAVWTKGSIPGDDPHAELSSAGFGLIFAWRPQAIKSLSLRTFVGKPVKAVAGQRSPRYIATMSMAF